MRVELSGLEEARAWLRKAPRRLKRAMAVYTNNQAYTGRELMIQSIHDEMTIRGDRFVRGSVTYQKCFLGGNPPFRATAGSIKRDRFTGWVEQETGRPPERDREMMMPARRGRWKRKVVPSSRLKPGKEFPDSYRTAGGTGRNKVVGMLRILQRRGEKGHFIIHHGQHPKLPGGLYRFKGRKTTDGLRPIQMVQGFQRFKPKRKPWMTRAVRSYTRRVRPQGEWTKALQYVFK